MSGGLVRRRKQLQENQLLRTPFTRSNIPMQSDRQRMSIASARARSSGVSSLGGLAGRTVLTVTGVSATVE